MEGKMKNLLIGTVEVVAFLIVAAAWTLGVLYGLYIILVMMIFNYWTYVVAAAVAELVLFWLYWRFVKWASADA